MELRRINGMQHISEVVRDANYRIHRARTGQDRMLVTRWRKVNEKIDGIFYGELICIAARPGVGKSAFANLLIMDLFNQELNPDTSPIGLYFTFEMPSYQQIIRMYSNKNRIESKKIRSSRNPIPDEVFDELQRTGNLLASLPIYLRDVPLSPQNWYEMILGVVADNPGKQIFVFLDHTRLVIPDQREAEERTITSLLGYANRLKNEQGVTTILISQMNRDIEKEKDRQRMGSSPPVLADIFGASAVEQFCTTVFMLHRPSMYGVSTYLGFDTKNLLAVHVPKQREGWTGAIMLKEDYRYYDIFDGDTISTSDDGRTIFNFSE